MALNAPTVSQIRSANQKAVGGGRKRCRKGKNCSATCISGADECLVGLSENVGVSVSKVRNMLVTKQKPRGVLSGQYRGGPVVKTLDENRTNPLDKKDLDLMEAVWRRYTKTGEVTFPFRIPKKYDDRSGTAEAVNEIVAARDKLSQDKKTGKIGVPENANLSKKARSLINEWNSLDMSTVYVNSAMGNRLNVSGLGVMAGPRNSVPKDAVRGLVQYVALRRQQAELEDGPNGKRITSYRDPFTGRRRPYMIGDSVVASQDHWMKPFGIYGIKSENDVKNTVYMPASMNVNKGESSPGRYLYILLSKNGRVEGKHTADRSAVGGFAGRYDKDTAKDFLPRGFTREMERKALGEKAQSMITTANKLVDEKVIPRVTKALSGGEITMSQAAKLVTDIAKHEGGGTYFGGDLRFANGMRILTPYEQEITKGIKLSGSVPAMTQSIQEAMEVTGKSPRKILEEILENRKGNIPNSSDRLKEYVPKVVVGRTTEKDTPTPKSSIPVSSTPKTKKEMAEQILRDLMGK